MRTEPVETDRAPRSPEVPEDDGEEPHPRRKRPPVVVEVDGHGPLNRRELDAALENG